MSEKIFVTKPVLPDLNKFTHYIKQIWESQHLTNNGPLLQELESKIKQKYLIKNLNIVSNGTVALQLAYKALDIKGKVLTTPFSFIATASTLAWERINFDFIDIDPSTFNVSPEAIERIVKIEKIDAVVLTHVFGNACEVDRIEELAKKYKFKVVYDAAHAFGVKYGDKSIFEFGDISTCSFHATKVFHTVEGGLVTSKNKEIQDKIQMIMNFGLRPSDGTICEVGINAKNSEIHCAMGLSLFDQLDEFIKERKNMYELYRKKLSGHVVFQAINKNQTYNYSYMPVLFSSNDLREGIVKKLNEENIFPRRYFSPSLNSLKTLGSFGEMKTSENISSRILCLPLFIGMSDEIIEKICTIINNNLKV